jgi:hypothetical protein
MLDVERVDIGELATTRLTRRRSVTPAAVCPNAAGGFTSGQDQRTNHAHGHGRGPGHPAEPFAVTSISG